VSIPSIDELRAIKKLMTDEQGGERLTLRVGPATTFTMIGFLQLCLRSDQVTSNGYLKATANTLCLQLSEPFRGTPVWDAIQRGYDGAQDVTVYLPGEPT